MERRSVEAVLGALNEAGVRYLVVGGLAVVLHGYVRFTQDIDLVLDPDPGALKRAVEALKGQGYRPLAPVPFEQFADAAKRKEWATEKNMLAFNTRSEVHAKTPVDLFLESPFDFDSVYSRARFETTRTGLRVSVVPLRDLVEMKRRAGRQMDLVDIDQLSKATGEDFGHE